ncbi:MAG: non-ribosomal peptide synthetase, partial [Cyclobacteriaceae bacterium]
FTGSWYPAIIPIDLDETFYQTESKENVVLRASADDTAYIIYTSGTTGQPKGVMVPHRSAIYYLRTFRNLIDRKALNMLSVLNYCFDAALPTLLSGTVGLTTTHIMEEDGLKEKAVERYIEDRLINVMRLTPSIMASLDLSGISNEMSIVLGGEKIIYDSVNHTIENPNIRLFNQYGPTESTVGSTVYPLTKKTDRQLIGKAYDGKRSYVLDNEKRPLPVGITGELYLGGSGLAKGYYKRPELTNERFIDNPFLKENELTGNTGDKIYKTGDLVRRLADGNLEYVGRNDDQVKVRGYRVELAEIEFALNAIENVGQSCVMVKKRGEGNTAIEFLVAYYVCYNTNAPETDLREKLSQSVPEYMIPQVFVKMESFPFTSNGKLDKRAFPDPDFSESETAFAAPTTENEIKVCELWKKLLLLDKVGIHDDFFRLGGNSILAVQVSHGMSKLLDLEVKVADVFKYTTIAGLLEHILTTAADESQSENQKMVF